MEMLADAAAAGLGGGVASPPAGFQPPQPPAGALPDPQGNDGAQETTAPDPEPELTVKQKSAPGAAGMDRHGGGWPIPSAHCGIPGSQPPARGRLRYMYAAPAPHLHNADAIQLLAPTFSLMASQRSRILCAPSRWGAT